MKNHRKITLGDLHKEDLNSDNPNIGRAAYLTLYLSSKINNVNLKRVLADLSKEQLPNGIDPSERKIEKLLDMFLRDEIRDYYNAEILGVLIITIICQYYGQFIHFPTEDDISLNLTPEQLESIVRKLLQRKAAPDIIAFYLALLYSKTSFKIEERVFKIKNALIILKFIIEGLNNSIRFLSEHGTNPTYTQRKLNVILMVKDRLKELLNEQEA